MLRRLPDAARCVGGCVGRRAGGQSASGQRVGSCNARLHLRDMRQPVYALGRPAALLADLLGRASIRPSPRPGVEHPRRSLLPAGQGRSAPPALPAGAFVALILRAPEGNILWDCIPFIDAATIEIVKALGGLTGIAISHPHYYGTMVEWSRAFGGAPIHLHAADRQWIMRPDPVIKLWEGDT